MADPISIQPAVLALLLAAAGAICGAIAYIVRLGMSGGRFITTTELGGKHLEERTKALEQEVKDTRSRSGTHETLAVRMDRVERDMSELEKSVAEIRVLCQSIGERLRVVERQQDRMETELESLADTLMARIDRKLDGMMETMLLMATQLGAVDVKASRFRDDK